MIKEKIPELQKLSPTGQPWLSNSGEHTEGFEGKPDRF